eukprot:10964499-Karenia_brevis.AAC.1
MQDVSSSLEHQAESVNHPVAAIITVYRVNSVPYSYVSTFYDLPVSVAVTWAWCPHYVSNVDHLQRFHFTLGPGTRDI